jgi:hypothetical protein
MTIIMNIQARQPVKLYWFAVILLLPVTLGIGALVTLFQSPEAPDCSSDSLSNQAASSIFYCANMLAAEQDVDKLHQAIQLVNNLPKDNPLHNDNLLGKWSSEILEKSEQVAQSGELSKAVDMANMIPVNLPAHKIALQKIQQWKSIWSQAEVIVQAAKEIIAKDEKESRYLALQKAKELRKLDNNYWATTQYQELVHYIQDVIEKKEEAKRAESEITQSITQGETDLAQELKVTQESDFVQSLAVKQEAEDIIKLKKARVLASSGKLEDMKAAVDEANLVISDTKYVEAQNFINSIKNKIELKEDIAYLQEAKQLALKDDEFSLQLAINRASLIGEESQVSKEANNNIAKWKDRLLKLSSEKSSPQPKPTTEYQENIPEDNLN